MSLHYYYCHPLPLFPYLTSLQIFYYVYTDISHLASGSIHMAEILYRYFVSPLWDQELSLYISSGYAV